VLLMQGNCKQVDLSSRPTTGQSGSWNSYDIPLTAFDWESRSSFAGCSDSITADKVNKVVVINTNWWNQGLCVDQVQLV
jgi:hypothetical protein